MERKPWYVLDPSVDDSPESKTAYAMDCSLNCVHPTAYDEGQGPAPDEPWRTRDLIRVQVHAKLEDLPTDAPTEVRYHDMPR